MIDSWLECCVLLLNQVKIIERHDSFQTHCCCSSDCACAKRIDFRRAQQEKIKKAPLCSCWKFRKQVFAEFRSFLEQNARYLRRFLTTLFAVSFILPFPCPFLAECKKRFILQHFVLTCNVGSKTRGWCPLWTSIFLFSFAFCSSGLCFASASTWQLSAVPIRKPTERSLRTTAANNKAFSTARHSHCKSQAPFPTTTATRHAL